jgi:hypothetical protein
MLSCFSAVPAAARLLLLLSPLLLLLLYPLLLLLSPQKGRRRDGAPKLRLPSLLLLQRLLKVPAVARLRTLASLTQP